jgi:hypothetical protein
VINDLVETIVPISDERQVRSIIQEIVAPIAQKSDDKQVRSVMSDLLEFVIHNSNKAEVRSVLSELVEATVQTSKKQEEVFRTPSKKKVKAVKKKSPEPLFQLSPQKSFLAAALAKLKEAVFGKTKVSPIDAIDLLVGLVETTPKKRPKLSKKREISTPPQQKPAWVREIDKKVESLKIRLEEKKGPRNKRVRYNIRKALRKLDLQRYGLSARTPKKTRSVGPSPRVRDPKHRVSPDDMKRLAKMSGRPLPDVTPASLIAGIRPIPMRLQPDSDSESKQSETSSDDEKYPAAPLPRVPAIGPPVTTVAPTVAQPPPAPARIKFLKTLMPHIYKPAKIIPLRLGKPLKGHRKVTKPRREKLGNKSEVYILPHQFEFILYPGVTDSEIRHVVQRVKSHLYSTSNAVVTSLLEIKNEKHHILLENYDLRECRSKTLFNVFRKHAPKRMKVYKRFVLYQHNASGGSLTTATAFSLGYRQFLNF